MVSQSKASGPQQPQSKHPTTHSRLQRQVTIIICSTWKLVTWVNLCKPPTFSRFWYTNWLFCIENHRLVGEETNSISDFLHKMKDIKTVEPVLTCSTSWSIARPLEKVALHHHTIRSINIEFHFGVIVCKILSCKKQSSSNWFMQVSGTQKQGSSLSTFS